MNCPKCSRGNPDHANYCLNCGSRLLITCSECGTVLPQGAKFCLKCGNRISEREVDQIEGRDQDTFLDSVDRLIPREYAKRLREASEQISPERRLVTILFSDIKGSTTIAEGLDPEIVLEVMNGAFEVLIEPVIRYEGTLARLMGDAVLAFFGAPISHENDPERAIRAGLEIVAGAQRYAEKLLAEHGIKNFDVRVGINTGQVVVGEVGTDLRVEYTAIGDAINLAARLESNATPGTVLISGATHDHVRGVFEALALGDLEVAGRIAPVQTYQVVGLKAIQDHQRGIPGLDSPLVGRIDELSQLEEVYERLMLGVGGIVTVIGEAGIGKSRLVAEMRNAVSSDDVHWVEGHCQSFSRAMAYQYWIDIANQITSVVPARQHADITSVTGQSETSMGNDFLYEGGRSLIDLIYSQATGYEIGPLDDWRKQHPKEIMVEAVEELVKSLTMNKPTIVVYEDMQWSDESSLEIMRHVFGLTDSLPLVCICVFRPERGTKCWKLYEDVARYYPHRHVNIQLTLLSQNSSDELVRNLVEGDDGLIDLCAQVYRQTDGNPFYIEEVIRSYIEQGILELNLESGNWCIVRELDSIPYPKTLQGLLNARIDGLGEDARKVLRVASVIGRRFTKNVLEQVLDTGTGVGEQLVALQRSMLIRELARIPQAEYTFQHQLTHRAAYDGLLKRDRKQYHARVALVIEQHYEDRIEEKLGLLAYHYERSGNTQKAVDYLIQAGDQARSLYAHKEAEGYYQKAVNNLEEAGESERAARTLLKLGLVYTAAFDAEKARDTYQQAFEIWTPLRDSHKMPQSLESASLRFAIEQPPQLDPGLLSDDVSIFISAQMFEGLVRIGRDYNVLPAAAERWEISEAGTKYVFYLKDKLKWSDGKELTASDYEYAWKRNLSPSTGSPAANLLFMTKGAAVYGQGMQGNPDQVGVRALDEFRLEVSLEQPTAYFPYVVAQPVAYPLPKHVIEQYGERWTEPGIMVGNGPYQLSELVEGERLVLTRNENYAGIYPGNVEQISLPIFTSFRPVLESYENGQVDVAGMFNVDPGLIARAERDHPGELIPIPRTSTLFINFRTDMTPFDNWHVRQAFVRAVDRKMLVEKACFGQRLPATGGFIPQGMAGHSPDGGVNYDPQAARVLFEQAGYANASTFPKVEWLYGLGSEEQCMVEFLRDAWRDVLGIELESEGLELREFMERLLNNPAEITIVGWSADLPDPDYMLRPTFHSQQGANIPHWSNHSYDTLLDEAASISNHERRITLYKEADRILVKDQAVIMPLTYGLGRMLVKPWVDLPDSLSVQMPIKSFIIKARERNQ